MTYFVQIFIYTTVNSKKKSLPTYHENEDCFLGLESHTYTQTQTNTQAHTHTYTHTPTPPDYGIAFS